MERQQWGSFQVAHSFLRFKVNGAAPRHFDEDHLDKLKERQSGRKRIASADGIETGWTAGEHVLDTDFHLAKNIINDTLTFDLRVETDRLPGRPLASLLRGGTEGSLEEQPERFPEHPPEARSKGDRPRPARTGSQGRPVPQAEVHSRFCGTASRTRCSSAPRRSRRSIGSAGLFEQTFGLELECVTAGRRAYQLAELHSAHPNGGRFRAECVRARPSPRRRRVDRRREQPRLHRQRVPALALVSTPMSVRHAQARGQVGSHASCWRGR